MVWPLLQSLLFSTTHFPSATIPDLTKEGSSTINISHTYLIIDRTQHEASLPAVPSMKQAFLQVLQVLLVVIWFLMWWRW